jgi:hypothetical protein
MREFHRKGFDRLYKRLTEILKAKVDVCGMMGAAWFYDPVIPALSPHLAFLQEVPLKYGAQTFRYEVSAGAKRDSLLNSPQRQQAYDQGRYVPATYILIWPREGMLRWASHASEAI